MRFAPAIDELTPFLAMEVMERGMQMRREGKEILQLGVGEPNFDAAPEVVEAAERALRDGQTHYTDSRGLRELREAIAADCERRRGHSVDPDRILITSGTSPAISMVFRLLLSPGDELLLPTPHYPCYVNMAILCGARCVTVPTRAEDGYAIDVDALRAAVTPRTRAVVLASPANPTGAVQPRHVVEGISQLGLPVIGDNLRRLLYDGAEHHSPLGMTPDCFIFDGFSKRHAMTGFRLGYVIAPEQALRPLQSMQQNLHISAAHFVQRAGLAALEHGAAHARHMLETYTERRQAMLAGIRRLGLDVPVAPRGAFYVFAGAQSLGADSLQVAFDLLQRAGVAVGPGRDFGEAGEGHLRFSYAAALPDIERAMERLEVALAS